MTAILRPLFGGEVLVDEVDPRRVSPAVLLPPEAAQVERAVAKRRREFAAGRLLARRLMGRLGVAEDFALVNGPDRAPLWPAGIVGTISHTRTRAAAAVAAAGDLISLGCDLEVDKPLEEGILRRVCGRRERDWIASRPTARRGRLAMLVFSAKEAAYKAQYPVSRRLLDFSDFRVRFGDGSDGGAFQAELRRDVAPWRRRQVLNGRWRVADGLVATAVTIRSVDVEDSRLRG